MGNPIYNDYKSNDPVKSIIQQAQEFRNNFRGDAKNEVQSLLNSGKMSQAQFNQLMPIAQRIAAMMPRN